MVTWSTSTDWDNAASESDVFHPSDVVNLAPEPDGFETYSNGAVPSPWNAPTSITVDVTDAQSTQWGSKTCHFLGDPGNDTVVLENTNIPNAAYTEFQFAYWEVGSGQTGVHMNLYDGTGARLCKVGTNNPEVEVWDDADQDGILENNQLLATPSPEYEAWRRMTITIDWANETFDVLWEDITGSTADQSATGYTLAPNNGVIGEVGYTSDEGGGSAMDCYIDQASAFLSDGNIITSEKIT